MPLLNTEFVSFILFAFIKPLHTFESSTNHRNFMQRHHLIAEILPPLSPDRQL